MMPTHIVELTIDEANKIPSMLGRICCEMLLMYGFYECNVGNVPIRYILKKNIAESKSAR